MMMMWSKGAGTTPVSEAEYGHDDSYKTVMAPEYGNEDFGKSVMMAERGRDDTFKTCTSELVPGPGEADGHMRDGMVCGMRRKVFWIVAGIIIFIIVAAAAIIGGVVASLSKDKAAAGTGTSTASGGRTGSADSGNDPITLNETLSGSKSQYKGLSILPNTALSAINSKNNIRIYYQNGDGAILYHRCDLPDSCEDAKATNITDAKLFTPLATAGNLTDKIHIFYLNKDNHIRSKIITSDGETEDETVTSYDQEVHPESKLAADYFPNQSEILKLYFQATDDRIKELVYTNNSNWTRGGILEEAAEGSSITTFWFDDSTQTIPDAVRQLRVFYVNVNDTFTSKDWEKKGGWRAGEAPPRYVDPGAGMTGFIWMNNAISTPKPESRVYLTDSFGEAYEVGCYTGIWSSARDDDKKQVGTVANTNSPLASVHWYNGNISNIHVFFQTTNKTLDEAIYTDTDGWSNGPGISLD